jgi:DNA invertase Pin-like site-specific DNA recombinase
MLSVLGALVQFERDLIKERQRDGTIANQRGAYEGRKRARLPRESRSCVLGSAPVRKNLACLRGETLYQYLRLANEDRK